MTLPSERRLWPWHAGALGVYAALAVALIWHFEPLTARLQGYGGDPIDCLWFLDWWPWAISHHLNPLHAGLIWQPLGVYLAWVTGVPLLSLLGTPLTLLGGPALTYNFFSITAPVGAAFTAYFLCLRIGGRPGAAMIGGFLFGFSSYEMAEELGTLDLSVTLLVPVLLLLVVMRLEGEMSRARFALLGGLALIGQFLICIEVAATALLFGGIAWGFALLYMPARRAVLLRLVADALAAAPFVILVLSPFLLSMARHPHFVNHPAIWPYFFTTDLANIVIPTRLTALGGSALSGISKHFAGGAQEQCGYIGLPLLGIVWAYAREAPRVGLRRLLLVCLCVFVVLSFGPGLWVGGHYTAIALPWDLFVHLPLLGAALPARFAMFSALVLAIIATLWLAAAPAGKAGMGRYALAILACLALLSQPHPWFAVPQARFFQPGNVQAKLGPNPRLLLLPFSINGPSSAWQQESGFSFSQTGGYLGFPPAAMQRYPAVLDLFGNVWGGDFPADFTAFCDGTATQFVVAGPGTPAGLLAVLMRLNWPHRQVDDVTIFTVPGQGANG
jgi:hypothetical protein